MMKTTYAALFLLSTSITSIIAQSSSSDACLTVTTVDDFNLTQYASAPWYVQQQAVNTYTPLDLNRCVTAQYSLKENPNFWGYTIDVFNYGVRSDGGQSSGGELCADYNKDIPSQLKVAPCFLPKFFAGPYWIVAYQEETDNTDGYALVSGGQPRDLVPDENNCGENGTDACCKTGDGINNSGLWILTRQPTPSNDILQEVRTIAQQKGFSTSVLFDVDHTNCTDIPGINDNTRTRFLRQQQ
jgi:lipocalin